MITMLPSPSQPTFSHIFYFTPAGFWNRIRFIPQDDPLVKIKQFLNLDFMEELVKDNYKNDNNRGRDPIDPRTLFLAWFVGLSFEDKAPSLKK